MQNVPHKHNVCLGQVFFEEVAGDESNAIGNSGDMNILLKNWLNFRPVESQAAEVGVCQRDLDCEVPLRGTDIDESVILSATEKIEQ